MANKIIAIIGAICLLAFTIYMYTRTPEPITTDIRAIDSTFMKADSKMLVRIKKVERRVKSLENGK
jgi:hypothetical protein